LVWALAGPLKGSDDRENRRKGNEVAGPRVFWRVRSVVKRD